MFLRWIAILMIFTSQCVGAVEFPIQLNEYLDGKQIFAAINESDIDEKLSWNPEAGAPPLSIADALTAVRKEIVTGGVDSAVEVVGIELKQIPHHPRQWHYLVKMINRHGAEHIPVYFVVLMNARVVPALARPEPIS